MKDNAIQNESMSALNNLIGYGNPKSYRWVFGIEEAGAWEENLSLGDEELFKFLIKEKPIYYSNDVLIKQCPSKYKEINDVLMLKGKRGFYGKLNSLLDIKVEQIGDKNEDLFIGNFYPLANNSSSDEYPKHYFDKFGVSSRCDYQKRYEADRIHKLKLFFDKYFENIDFLILFGKGLWGRYKTILGELKMVEEDYSWDTINANFLLAKYKNTKILLLAHPNSRGYFNVNNVKSFLNENPPRH